MARVSNVKPKGKCPECKGVKALTGANRMWWHQDPATKKECAGVGAEPVRS